MPEYDDNQSDIAALHHALIDQLKTKQLLETERIEAAFRAVPRHLFLPDVPLERVYSDDAIPTKFENGRAISSSSQPAIMAIMLEQLDLQPGYRVLEIGAGTGYNAALMAHIVGDGGHITTVDLDEDTVEKARANLAAAGFEQVHVVCGDGMAGYADNAPYDRIILTVGGWDITPQWLEQLKGDGRILLPLSINGPQLSVAFDRQDGHWVSVSVKPCGFMRMRGQWADPHTSLRLSSDPDMGLEMNDDSWEIDTAVVYGWLTSSGQQYDAGIEVRPRMLWGLNLWLALHEPRAFGIGARGERAGDSPVPRLLGDGPNWVATFGLLSATGLAVLMRPPDAPVPPQTEEPPPPFTLFVHSFGPNRELAQRLIDQVQAWDKADRPGVAGLRIRAYPVGGGFTAARNEQVVTKQWHQFVIDYPDN